MLMANKPTYKVPRRRRREGKTNYRKRLELLKSGKPRLVVRMTHNQAIAQVIEYHPEGDRTIVSATSRELKKYGWTGHGGNCAAAYLTGYLCGKKALKAGIKELVPDIGLHTPVHGSNVFAVIKGGIDAGVLIPADESAFPAADRLAGKHLKNKQDVESIKNKIGEENV